MIETAINFAIGFLLAAVLGLLFVPLFYKRAVRLAVQHAVSAAPYPTEEMLADKEQLRGKLSVSTRQLELSMVEMKSKTLSTLADLSQKTNVIHQLKNELDEKVVTISSLQDRNKFLHEKLLATEHEFEIRGNALREAEDVIAGKEAELVKLVGELGEHTVIADNQRVEIDALREQVEAIRESVSGYENALKETALRFTRGEPESAHHWANAADDHDELVGSGSRRNGRS